MSLSRLLRASLQSIALRWLLAALLLLAQQGALTHALSHAGGHAHEAVSALQSGSHVAGDAASAHSDAHKTGGGRGISAQCAFDLVYSQVLGGVHAGHSVCINATETVAPRDDIARSFSAITHVPYDTRGPPAVS